MMGSLLTGLHRGALCAHAAQQANSMGILSNAETTGVAFVVDFLFLNGKNILTWLFCAPQNEALCLKH